MMSFNGSSSKRHPSSSTRQQARPNSSLPPTMDLVNTVANVKDGGIRFLEGCSLVHKRSGAIVTVLEDVLLNTPDDTEISVQYPGYSEPTRMRLGLFEPAPTTTTKRTTSRVVDYAELSDGFTTTTSGGSSSAQDSQSTITQHTMGSTVAAESEESGVLVADEDDDGTSGISSTSTASKTVVATRPQPGRHVVLSNVQVLGPRPLEIAIATGSDAENENPSPLSAMDNLESPSEATLPPRLLGFAPSHFEVPSPSHQGRFEFHQEDDDKINKDDDDDKIKDDNDSDDKINDDDGGDDDDDDDKINHSNHNDHHMKDSNNNNQNNDNNVNHKVQDTAYDETIRTYYEELVEELGRIIKKERDMSNSSDSFFENHLEVLESQMERYRDRSRRLSRRLSDDVRRVQNQVSDFERQGREQEVEALRQEVALEYTQERLQVEKDKVFRAELANMHLEQENEGLQITVGGRDERIEVLHVQLRQAQRELVPLKTLVESLRGLRAKNVLDLEMLDVLLAQGEEAPNETKEKLEETSLVDKLASMNLKDDK